MFYFLLKNEKIREKTKEVKKNDEIVAEKEKKLLKINYWKPGL